MQISVQFDPVRDPLAQVIAAVTRAYEGAGNFSDFELGNAAINIAAHSASDTSQTAASAPAAATSNTVDGVELDVNGVPWDARIHSDAAERKTAKGEWKKRKGVDDLTRTTVHNELLAMMAAKIGNAGSPSLLPPGGVVGGGGNSDTPVHVAVPVPGSDTAHVAVLAETVLTPPTLQVADTLAPPAATAVLQPAPVTEPAPVAPLVLPNLAPPAEPSDFAGLMDYIATHMTSGKILQGHIDHACSHYSLLADGKASLQMLAGRPDLIKPMYDYFKAVVGQ